MKIVTMNQLHENTSGVIQELNHTRKPFLLTRRGRLLALITPLPDFEEQAHHLSCGCGKHASDCDTRPS
jgi:hypothetical protein